MPGAPAAPGAVVRGSGLERGAGAFSFRFGSARGLPGLQHPALPGCVTSRRSLCGPGPAGLFRKPAGPENPGRLGQRREPVPRRLFGRLASAGPRGPQRFGTGLARVGGGQAYRQGHLLPARAFASGCRRRRSCPGFLRFFPRPSPLPVRRGGLSGRSGRACSDPGKAPVRPRQGLGLCARAVGPAVLPVPGAVPCARGAGPESRP